VCGAAKFGGRGHQISRGPETRDQRLSTCAAVQMCRGVTTILPLPAKQQWKESVCIFLHVTLALFHGSVLTLSEGNFLLTSSSNRRAACMELQSGMLPHGLSTFNGFSIHSTTLMYDWSLLNRMRTAIA